MNLNSAHDFSLAGARIALCEGFLDTVEADRMLASLERSVAWRRDTLRLFGREHPVPRLHQWHGDPGAVYRWSGLTMQPQPWLDDLTLLRRRIEKYTGCRFNSVLANLYRDGNDSMGWHSDDEPELGPEPVIASISLGATRDLLLRYRNRAADVPNAKLELGHGSLLVMSGETQVNWQHSLPKRRRIDRPRINLTFRWIYPAG